MLVLGDRNSRIKDFFDLRHFAQNFTSTGGFWSRPFGLGHMADGICGKSVSCRSECGTDTLSVLLKIGRKGGNVGAPNRRSRYKNRSPRLQSGTPDAAGLRACFSGRQITSTSVVHRSRTRIDRGTFCRPLKRARDTWNALDPPTEAGATVLTAASPRWHRHFVCAPKRPRGRYAGAPVPSLRWVRGRARCCRDDGGGRGGAPCSGLVFVDGMS